MSRRAAYELATAAPTDEFDMYGIELPLDGWSYAVDDFAQYGPGWFPFHRPVTRNVPDPRAPLSTLREPTGRTEPCRVRISPDAAHLSWRNEYVELNPFDHRVEARMRLFVGRRGMGAMVRRATVEVDLRAGQVTLPELPGELREQAAVKAQRVVDLLAAGRRERRRGVRAPEAILAPGLRGL